MYSGYVEYVINPFSFHCALRPAIQFSQYTLVFLKSVPFLRLLTLYTPRTILSCQVNQSARYVHSCLQFATLIKTSTNNPCQKSVVIESSAKRSLGGLTGSLGLVWQKIQEPLTRDAPLLGVVGVKIRTVTLANERL